MYDTNAVQPETHKRFLIQHNLGTTIDFLKVLGFSFPVPVVGPSAKDFYPLQRAKFTGGIFLL